MNFAENEKWPSNPVWRAPPQKLVGGYERGTVRAGNAQTVVHQSARAGVHEKLQGR